VPLCQAAAVGVVHALLGDGENALVGEEELFNGAFGSCMSAVRGVARELGAVERSNTALAIACPKQLLCGVKSERRDRRSGMVRPGRWYLRNG
jgi:hypothetical protein